MNKDKLITIINIILLACYLIADIIIGFVNDFNISFYYSTISFLMATSLTCLIIIMIRLMVNKDYEFKRFTLIMYAGILVISVLCYYLIKYLKHYYEYWYLYWGLCLLGNVTIIIVCSILNKKKPSNNGPKIIANR